MLKNYIKPSTYSDCWSVGYILLLLLYIYFLFSVTIAELYTGKTLFPCTAKDNKSQAQYKFITDYLGKHIFILFINLKIL